MPYFASHLDAATDTNAVGILNPRRGGYYIHGKNGNTLNLGADNMVDENKWINVTHDRPEEPKPATPPVVIDIPTIVPEPLPTVTHSAPPITDIISPTKWKTTTSLRPDGKPVEMISTNTEPIELHDLEGKSEVKIVLPPQKSLRLVSKFKKADDSGQDVWYVRDELLIKGGWYYSLRLDMLQPAPVPSENPQPKQRDILDFNRDGKTDLQDVAGLGDFIATASTRAYTQTREVVNKLNLPEKLLDTRMRLGKSIDGFGSRIKRKDKVQ